MRTTPDAVRTRRSLRPRPASSRRSIPLTLAAVEEMTGESAGLISRHIRLQYDDGTSVWLPRYLLIGPQGGDDPLRIGIFAGIHGDEPEGVHALIQFITLLERQPELARGYCLFIYPICNPSGFEDCTRHSRSGHDLNREFWRDSRQPEVIALQRELILHSFHGIISLHSDDTSEGIYGYARGDTLTEHLLKPALQAAEAFLPRDGRSVIDGFDAREGIIRDCFEGVLSPRSGVHPQPFEIIFETPQHAMQPLQHGAMTAFLVKVLDEYRRFIAYQRNL